MNLILITTVSWDDFRGSLKLIKGDELVSKPIPVVLGKTGLAWGIGLHPEETINKEEPQKKEGDNKSPAGIFSIGPRFGIAPSNDSDYIQITSSIVAVDDPNSAFYNQIVDRAEIKADFESCEEMKNEPLYEMGAVIQHNFPNPSPGAGSAIFFHLWKDEGTPTAGCTAMSRENLEKVLLFIQEEETFLVQIPVNEWKSGWAEIVELEPVLLPYL